MLAGNVERVTGIFPTDVEGTVAVTAAGTCSVLVFINLPGDQSLTVPSEYTH